MGSSDAETPGKTPKAPSVTPEQPPGATGAVAMPAVYPDWPGFQGYAPIPPHGFFPSPVASSPQAHSYMWGAQHLMPPYGTPPPYVMYPPGHGSLYAHPSFPPGMHPYAPYTMASPNGHVDAAGNVPGGLEAKSKPSNAKEKGSLKRTKGSLGSLNMITGKNNDDPGKASGISSNGVFSQSGESGSEASSDGTDANSENDSPPNTSQNGTAGCDSQNGIARTSSQSVLSQTMAVMAVPVTSPAGGVAGPTTNLNIGMDYWGAAGPQAVHPIRGKVLPTPAGGAVVPPGYIGSNEIVPSDMWLKDERELKRQKRKQSNRESARRSRLRKQAECEDLAQRLDVLKEENANLSAEMASIRKEYDELVAQNASLKERLGETPDGGTEGTKPNGEHDAGDGRRDNLDSKA